jgi:Lon protease-like protein
VLAIPAEFQLLATILERLLEKTGGPHASSPRARFDDAAWVGFRLAEALPIDNRERQHLLQLHEPIERLQQLMHYLPRFQQA